MLVPRALDAQEHAVASAPALARLADDGCPLHEVEPPRAAASGDELVALRGQVGEERFERKRLAALQRLATSELQLAQRVNLSLLPVELQQPGVDVVVRQIPCDHIGGDYLFAESPAAGLLYLCVGDVSGHGVSAALVVSRLHGLVMRLVQQQRTPSEIVTAVDAAAIVVLCHTSLFLTFAAFRVDVVARRIDYVTAGHPAQVLLRAVGGDEQLMTATGLLGTGIAEFPGDTSARSVEFLPGDTLVLFTDGLFEVAARDGSGLLGEDGLLGRLLALATQPPDVLADALLAGVARFASPGPYADDVSLMVVRFSGGLPGRRAAEGRVHGRLGERPIPSRPRASSQGRCTVPL